MRKYQRLINYPPELEVKSGAREVIFNLISAMCDNRGTLRFKKNSEGDFKMDGRGDALSNFQMKCKTHEVEWKADEEEWGEVIRMINSGTYVIESVDSR
jgi:hypothetical protein